MEMKFNSKAFLASLQQAYAVISARNSLPILDNVMIQTKDDGNGGTTAILVASDGEMWLQIKSPIAEGDKGLKICLNAKDLLNALKNLGDYNVAMTSDSEKQTVTCSYGVGQFSMPYEKTDEYPMPQLAMDGAIERIVNGERIFKAIDKTCFAVANDELRPVLNGINFEFCRDAMIVAASDGQKLARYTDNTITHDNDETYSFVLPAKVSVVVKSLLSAFNCDIKVSFTDKAVSFSSKEFKLTARLAEGRFPNYKSVIPQTYNVSAEIDKQNIVTALKRVLPMGSTSSELVLLRFADMKLVISTEDIDFSKSASETITCDYSAANAPITIGFKGSSLLQIIQNLDGENAVFELTDPARAAVIYDSDKNVYLSLIIPMLIQ